MIESTSFQINSLCEDLISKSCPTAFSTVSPLSSFESEFYQSLRNFTLKHPYYESQRILETTEKFINIIKTSQHLQLNSLIQRNVAGIRIKDLDSAIDIPTGILSSQERYICKNRSEAEELVANLAKQYLLAVRDYSKISPQLARSQFLISQAMAERLSFYTSSQIMNLCDRSYSILRFELTAPVSMYIKSIESGNAFSTVTKQAVALSKVCRELFSTTRCLGVLKRL